MYLYDDVNIMTNEELKYFPAPQTGVTDDPQLSKECCKHELLKI